MSFLRDKDLKEAKKYDGQKFFHLTIDEEVPGPPPTGKKGKQTYTYHPVLDCADVGEFNEQDGKVLDFPLVQMLSSQLDQTMPLRQLIDRTLVIKVFETSYKLISKKNEDE